VGKCSRIVPCSAFVAQMPCNPVTLCRYLRTRTLLSRRCSRLRLKVWKRASFNTRNICLSVKTPGKHNAADDSGCEEIEVTEEDGPVALEPSVYEVACPHPPILHTCRESLVGRP
jgi:hypothetical protein